jgi:hypothetical protein
MDMHTLPNGTMLAMANDWYQHRHLGIGRNPGTKKEDY